MKFSWRRVWAITLRHLYNFRRTMDRVVDAFYWPALDTIVLGLAFTALAKQGMLPVGHIETILFAIILWYILWRGQYEITVNLLEELWSANLANLFASPLTWAEWVLALFILGFLKLFLVVLTTGLVGFFLYHANVLTLGIALVPFVINLLMLGWVYGLLVASLFLRYGTKVQSLAWAGAYVVMPFSAIYYPLAILPQWMQKIALFVPSSYVFENMRAVVRGGEVQWDMMLRAFGLNIVFLAGGLYLFAAAFRKAREKSIAKIY